MTWTQFQDVHERIENLLSEKIDLEDWQSFRQWQRRLFHLEELAVDYYQSQGRFPDA